jgi:replication factor C subunit 2/4
LNASDERGISVVREKIKHFASLVVSNAGGSSKNSGYFASLQQQQQKSVEGTNVEKDPTNVEQAYPNPPFKIIILDEADTVTPDAQAALRRIIEAYSKSTRFILICNYVTRIIEPLASRCAKFRFQSLPPDSMMKRLIDIGYLEGVKYCPDGMDQGEKDECRRQVLEEILDLSRGDMRRAVTILQSAHILSCGSGSDRDRGGFIRKTIISEMAGLPPGHVTERLLDTCRNPTQNFENLERMVEDIMCEGYAAQHIMKDLLVKLSKLDSAILSDKYKAEIAIMIADADKCLIDSADDGLQLLRVCSLIFKSFRSQ